MTGNGWRRRPGTRQYAYGTPLRGMAGRLHARGPYQQRFRRWLFRMTGSGWRQHPGTRQYAYGTPLRACRSATRSRAITMRLRRWIFRMTGSCWRRRPGTRQYASMWRPLPTYGHGGQAPRSRTILVQFCRWLFSNDGQRLTSAAPGTRQYAYGDTATGMQLGAALEGHAGTVSLVAFSNDGQHLCSTSGVGERYVWDIDHLNDQHWISMVPVPSQTKASIPCEQAAIDPEVEERMELLAS